MSEFMSSITKGIKNVLAGLNKRQRLIVLAGGVMVFAAMFVFVIYSAKGPVYEILWSNLDPIDAGTIVNELEKQGVPYKLTDSGHTVKVPSDKVHRTRLSLATMGLPSSGIVGFEAVGSSSIWSTDFERKVQYLRALSGELTRTIKALSGVEDARVHIALPEDTVFATQGRAATASVLVKTGRGQDLTPASVCGIVNLVSKAVEGLASENVTVIDASGRLLSQDASYGSGGISDWPMNSVIDVTFATERELESRLLGLLAPIFGPGNVVCQVRAELNMRQVRIVDTTYESELPGILRSAQETNEIYEGSGYPPGGQAGSLDVPSYAASEQNESRYQRSESLTNYEVNETVTETMVVPGAIEKLSVAVVVNKDLNESDREIISETVTAALGLDSMRQDQISVTGLVFDTGLHQIFDASPPTAEGLPRIYIYAIAVFAALVVGTLILRYARRRREMAFDVSDAPAVAMESGPTISPELMARQKSRENVERLARVEPQLVATLVKSWLLEDER